MPAEIVNRTTGECVVTQDDGATYHLVFDMDAVLALDFMLGKAGRSLAGLFTQNPGPFDCQAMIIAGSQGASRRGRNGHVVMTENLAKKVLRSAGGWFALSRVLLESVARGEGMGLFDDEGEDGSDPPPGPGPAL